MLALERMLFSNTTINNAREYHSKSTTWHLFDFMLNWKTKSQNDYTETQCIIHWTRWLEAFDFYGKFLIALFFWLDNIIEMNVYFNIHHLRIYLQLFKKRHFGGVFMIESNHQRIYIVSIATKMINPLKYPTENSKRNNIANLNLFLAF